MKAEKAWGQLCWEDSPERDELPKNVWGYGETPQKAICETLNALGYKASIVSTNQTEVSVDYCGKEYVYICDWSDD